jgi:hypothetical protein
VPLVTERSPVIPPEDLPGRDVDGDDVAADHVAEFELQEDLRRVHRKPPDIDPETEQALRDRLT